MIKEFEDISRGFLYFLNTKMVLQEDDFSTMWNYLSVIFRSIVMKENQSKQVIIAGDNNLIMVLDLHAIKFQIPLYRLIYIHQANSPCNIHIIFKGKTIYLINF